MLGTPCTDSVGVIATVADQPLEGDTVEERLGLWAVGGLARRQQVAQRSAATIHQRVDLGGQAAARSAEVLLAAPSGPLAKRCALVMVASTITVSSASSGTPAVNNASQMPCCDQRRKRQ